MTADAIANVVSDLRTGRVRLLYDKDEKEKPNSVELAYRAAQLWLNRDYTVVDCTKIYHSLLEKDEPVYLYEDHPSIMSPWEEAAYCYVNEHGNVIVMGTTTRSYEHSNEEQRRAMDTLSEIVRTESQTPWEPAEPVEWERVKWIANTFIWVGGRSPETGPIQTSGPVHMWQYAIYESGEPADLHWVHVFEAYPMERWDMAQIVLLGALNFLNCRNVSIEEPKRSRAERRRIERTGVRVHEIMVTPTGRSTRSASPESTGIMPLTSVRGHFAHYGPKYGKGLLFGKLEGRFWIPQFARGDAEHGEHEHSYALDP
jgi:hypothetical protein